MVVGIRQNKENKGCWPKRLKAGAAWMLTVEPEVLEFLVRRGCSPLSSQARATDLYATVITLHCSATS